MNSADAAIPWYDAHASEVAERYERLDFEEVHGWLIPYLPNRTDATVLDVGAGSGRDAAWFARRGHEVVAVEPSAGLRAEGERRHRHPRIRWINDRLPHLDKATLFADSFDLILLSAVWMHVKPSDRARAFDRMQNLLKADGMMVITLRQGLGENDRGMHGTTAEELRRLAAAHGAYVERLCESDDLLGRDAITWAQLAIRPRQDRAVRAHRSHKGHVLADGRVTDK